MANEHDDDANVRPLVTAEVPQGHENTPFVLIWAERKAVDLLKKENLVFSEAFGGLENTALGDTPHTTNNPENAGDTSFPH